MARSTLLKHYTVSAYHRQKTKCFYCQTTMIDTQLTQYSNEDNYCTTEHLIPKSEGGKDEKGNIVAACRRCNNNRATKQEDINNYIQMILRQNGVNIQGMSKEEQHRRYLILFYEKEHKEWKM